MKTPKSFETVGARQAELQMIVETLAKAFEEGANKVYADALWPIDDTKTLGEWIIETANSKVKKVA